MNIYIKTNLNNGVSSISGTSVATKKALAKQRQNSISVMLVDVVTIYMFLGFFLFATGIIKKKQPKNSKASLGDFKL